MGTLVGGPLERTHIESRADVLCYTSTPLLETVDVIGSVTVRLFAATSRRDADFIVKLVDVAAEGTALLVTEGILRARYRNGFAKPGATRPDVVYELEIPMRPTAWRFPAGHRLRLEVAGSDFPQYDRNAGTGEPVGTDMEVRTATQRIRHTVAQPSVLLLSTMP